MDADALLRLEELRTTFSLDEGTLTAVDGVDLEMKRSMTVGLVGESGCGKSMTALSILRITPPKAKVGGRILFRGQSGGDPVDLARMDPAGGQIRALRGKEISMVFQEPMTSFSPLHTIGFQIREALLLHTELRGVECEERAVEMLAKVGIPDPARRVREYPHQLSGGMRQRAMIAMALSCNPSLLIADEPTTALDVTVQAQVLELMKGLQRETGMAILYITHNLGVVAEMVDTVAVMYLGRIVEIAPVDDIFYSPLHPYTQALLRSVPKLGARVKERLQSIEGTVPLPLNLGPQCHFHQRCPRVMKGMCDAQTPALTRVTAEHHVRCFLHSKDTA